MGIKTEKKYTECGGNNDVDASFYFYDNQLVALSFDSDVEEVVVFLNEASSRKFVNMARSLVAGYERLGSEV